MIELLIWVLFFLSSVFLTFIILMQEPKGGGLAEAFGGMGAETFGVKSSSVNKFTLSVAAIWIGAAILLQMW